MTLPLIRDSIKKYYGKRVVIDYDLGRNKQEIIEGIITKMYNRIFIVEEINKNIRSFSYADYITKTIKINLKN